MARYIDADEALIMMQHSKEDAPYYGDWYMAHDSCIDCVNIAPTADVVEVKHGEWKPIVRQDNYLEPPYCDTCKCSVCEYEIDVCETVYNYCPHCGAKMDVEGGAE